MSRFAAFTGPALNGTLDIVIRHALGPGCLDGAAQSRVAIGIAATGLGGDADFLGQLAEDLTAFRVDGALETLNLRPLAMSRHNGADLFKNYKVRLTNNSKFETDASRENGWRGENLPGN